MIDFKVYPMPATRGFVALGGKCGEALNRESVVQYDAGRRDCFFISEAEAQAAIAKYEDDHCDRAATFGSDYRADEPGSESPWA